MAVTAKFVPDRIEVLPNVTTALTLRLYNGDADSRAVTVSTSGDLDDHVRLGSTTAALEANQILDVVVTVLTPSSVEAGAHTIAADVTSSATGDSSGGSNGSAADQAVVATATVDVVGHSDYTVAIHPKRSRGSKKGRHAVRVANIGNTVITLDVAAESGEGDVAIGLGRGTLTVAPGATGELPVRVVPPTTYWSGQTIDHGFVLQATSGDGRSDQLAGTYQQRPRVPNWVGPTIAGAVVALLIGTIAWFALLRPWVQETADDAAADAIERDRIALQGRIAELEASAAEAEELPLGQPTDIRLDVAPTGGNTEQDSAAMVAGTLLSITDVVFQNPTGAVGTVSLKRGDEILLQSELANFRDFDLHFVAPYQFGDDVTIVLEVDCRTPGAGESTCPVGASFVGFIDEVG
jgi:hypothetical protein